jgi:hypothetical protein
MSTNQFAMVSEWMTNGNINEFIQAHRDANRFELVGLALLLTSLLADHRHLVPIAQRRRQGVDIYAQPGDDPWGPEGGMPSNTSRCLDS